MKTPLPWHHIHLTHENRADSADWYVKHLGARKGEGTPRSENLWYDKNLVQVQSDTGIKPPKTGEIDHIGIGVTNVSLHVGRAVNAGAEAVGDGMIVDPWGTRIQLVESDRPEFHHLMILCPEPQESGEWYAEHLGGELEASPLSGSDYAIRYDTMWLAFRQGTPAQTGPDQIRPIDHIGWYTPDIEQTVGDMVAAGCRFPVPTRPFGSVRLAFAEDPTGLWVELVELPGGRIPK